MNKTITTRAYQEFLAWLKSQRLERGLSMRDVGRLIDEPHQFVSKIETAERRLDVYEFAHYCKALGIDTSEGLKILQAKQ